MNFRPYQPPFHQWMGPYTPATGFTSGFRVLQNSLGCHEVDDSSQFFCTAEESPGVRYLIDHVRTHFGGGRVLFLPNGLVIKPCNRGYDVGRRVVIGEYSGDLRIFTSEGFRNFSDEQIQNPGTRWYGPQTIGLAIILEPRGCGYIKWNLSNRYYDEEHREPFDWIGSQVVESYQRVKGRTGRVRISVNGHAFTKVEEGTRWQTYYLGIADSEFVNWQQWAGEYA